MMGYEGVIRKSPQIIDEILIKLASHHDPLEKDILVLKNDILFILLAVILMENGFYPKFSDGSILENIDGIDGRCLTKWKLLSGLYEAEFVMLGCREISTKLIMIPLGTAVVVNVVINEMDSETYSVCLPVNQYVVLTEHERTVPKIFRSIRQLSDTFKNKVLSPVKSKILSICGYPGASLIGLPEDVFLKIISYLPISDVISVSKTCKTFKQVFDNDNVWHKLFIRDYKLTSANEEINWRLMYKEHYIKCVSKKKAQYHRVRLPPSFAWIY